MMMDKDGQKAGSKGRARGQATFRMDFVFPDGERMPLEEAKKDPRFEQLRRVFFTGVGLWLRKLLSQYEVRDTGSRVEFAYRYHWEILSAYLTRGERKPSVQTTRLHDLLRAARETEQERLRQDGAKKPSRRTGRNRLPG
jgi:hypothetical protein